MTGREFVIGRGSWPNPLHFGSGGAGYVFSRAALKKFVRIRLSRVVVIRI